MLELFCVSPKLFGCGFNITLKGKPQVQGSGATIVDITQ